MFEFSKKKSNKYIVGLVVACICGGIIISIYRVHDRASVQPGEVKLKDKTVGLDKTVSDEAGQQTIDKRPPSII